MMANIIDDAVSNGQANERKALVINLKAAKQIGLTIPQSVLYRADKGIR